MPVTFNPESQLYYIPCGGGYTTHGYQNVFDLCYRLRVWLIKENEPITAGIPDEPLERYAYYTDLLSQAREVCEKKRIKCEVNLHPKLVGLEGNRVECKRFGERVRFYVGRSTGWMPCHLAVKTARSSGGDAISHDEPLHGLCVIIK